MRSDSKITNKANWMRKPDFCEEKMQCKWKEENIPLFDIQSLRILSKIRAFCKLQQFETTPWRNSAEWGNLYTDQR